MKGILTLLENRDMGEQRDVIKRKDSEIISMYYFYVLFNQFNVLF